MHQLAHQQKLVGLLMQSSMIEKENIIMDVLLSTTTIDNSEIFEEYVQGVEAFERECAKPEFDLIEAYESFRFDPADSQFQMGYYDAIMHELEENYT